MRVLLASNASYDPPRGGSTRSNLAWLRHLTRAGHQVSVVCPTVEGRPDSTTTPEQITVHGVKDLSFRAAVLGQFIRAEQPGWVLVSSEDVSHVLIREAGQSAPSRLIYLAHTPQFMPFGPESWHADAAASAIVRRAASIITIGRHMAGYVETHLGRAATVIHPPIYGGPAVFTPSREGYVLMINPCTVKGLSIFLELARRFPQTAFAALTGWGTTGTDRAALAGLPNVRLLASVGDIDEALAPASLLLMPSLWYEGFGLIAMEAMLRGLPVAASNSGGLLEAKQDTGYVIPVRPITSYEAHFDETHMPRAVVPAQDIEPWAAALKTLLGSEEEYRAESRRSLLRAQAFVSSLDAADFERHLLALPPAPEPIPRPAARDMDPARRALLLARLKRAGRQSPDREGGGSA
ncbi:MAG: glycosyltransferase family 4 protein [Candidatus Solibacter usitatus]|nr:glycosyltransferase family 4 protein [Candidatus Solibacter usitatus]